MFRKNRHHYTIGQSQRLDAAAMKIKRGLAKEVVVSIDGDDYVANEPAFDRRGDPKELRLNGVGNGVSFVVTRNRRSIWSRFIDF